MTKAQCGYRLLTSTICAMGLLLAQSERSATADEAANTNVEAAAERAHFAQAFCGVTPERVDKYKERVRKAQSEASDFNRHWQTGWHRGDDDTAQMNSLRQRDPTEFAARAKSNCERLKWMAQNALRARSQK